MDRNLTPDSFMDRLETDGLLAQAASEYNIPVPLLRSVAEHESSLDQKRVSPKGAIGVMQLMPATAKDLGVNPHDKAQNVMGGAKYLRSLLDRYDGDTNKALAAYNFGMGNVDSGKSLPAETRDYVSKVNPGELNPDTFMKSLAVKRELDPDTFMESLEAKPNPATVPGMERIGALPGVPGVPMPAMREQSKWDVPLIPVPRPGQATTTPGKIARGGAVGGAEALEGFVTPRNVGIMGGLAAVNAAQLIPGSQPVTVPLAQAVNATAATVFGADMLKSAIENVPEFGAAVQRGDVEEAARILTTIGISAGMAATLAKHGIKSLKGAAVQRIGGTAALEVPKGYSPAMREAAPVEVPAPKRTAKPRPMPKQAEKPAPAPEPIPSEAPAKTLPDWAQESIDQRNALGEQLGVADQIESLAAKKLISVEIARELHRKNPKVSVGEFKDIVLGVRAKRGIPNLDNTSEFQAWLDKRAEPPVAPPLPPVEGTPVRQSEATVAPTGAPVARPVGPIPEARPTPREEVIADQPSKGAAQEPVNVAAAAPVQEAIAPTVKENVTVAPEVTAPKFESRERAETVKQMIEDGIALRKEKGQAIPQGWFDQLQTAREFLSGEKPPSEAGMASQPVFGHPTNSPWGPKEVQNVIPIRVSADTDLSWRIADVQKVVEELQTKEGRADAISKGRIKVTPKEVKEAKAYLQSANGRDDAGLLGTLRKETLPELYRLQRLVDSAKAEAPTPEAARVPEVAKQPWEMTRGEFDGEALYRGVDKHSEKGPNTYWSDRESLARTYGPYASSKIRVALKRDVDVAKLGGESVDSLISENERLGAPGLHIPEGLPAIAEFPSGTKDIHRAIIEQALSEGKPVPPAVLAEYPDLAPKPASAVETPAPLPPAESAAVIPVAEAKRTTPQTGSVYPKLPKDALVSFHDDVNLASDPPSVRVTNRSMEDSLARTGLILPWPETGPPRTVPGRFTPYPVRLSPKGIEVAKAFTERVKSETEGLPISDYEPGKAKIEPYTNSDGLFHNKVSGKEAWSDGHVLFTSDAPSKLGTRIPDFQRSWDPAKRDATKPVEPIGFYRPGGDLRKGPLIVLSDGSVLDSRYFDYAKKTFPDAEFRANPAGEGKTAIAVYSKRKMVGVIMPMKNLDVPKKLMPAAVEAPSPVADARTRLKDEEAFGPERGSISLKPTDPTAEHPRLKSDRGFIQTVLKHGVYPLGKVVEHEGQYGKELAGLIHRARDVGEVRGAARLQQVLDSGLKKLTEDQRFEMVDVLENRITSADVNVNKVAASVKAVLDDMAADATALNVKVKGREIIRPTDTPPPGLTPLQREKLASGKAISAVVRRSFEKIASYFPHMIPNVDLLSKGIVREKVLKNIVRLGVRTEREGAAKFVDSFIDYIDTGGREQSLIDYLVQTGQAVSEDAALQKLQNFRTRTIKRQGSLEYSRDVNLPFWNPDPLLVLPAHIISASNRLSQIRLFGQENQRINKLINQVRVSGGDYEMTRKAVDRILGIVRESDTGFGKVSRFLRVVQGFKLGLSAIPNATQTLNIALKADARALIAGLRGAATKEGRKFGSSSGAAMESTIQEILSHAGAPSEMLSKFLTATGFAGTERFNRVVSANAGREFSQRLLKKIAKNPADRLSREKLTELGVDVDTALRSGKLSADEIAMAGKRMSDLTQFRSRPEDLPLFASSHAGRVFFQFKNFIYGQTNLLYEETVKEFKNGHIGEGAKNLLLLATVFPLAGEAVADIRSLITGRERKEEGLKRYFDSIAQSGSLGILSNVAESAGRSKLAEFLLGPSLSDVAQVGETLMSANRGRNLMKMAFSRVPLVGQVLVNRLFPPLRGGGAAPRGDRFSRDRFDRTGGMDRLERTR